MTAWHSPFICVNIHICSMVANAKFSVMWAGRYVLPSISIFEVFGCMHATIQTKSYREVLYCWAVYCGVSQCGHIVPISICDIFLLVWNLNAPTGVNRITTDLSMETKKLSSSNGCSKLIEYKMTIVPNVQRHFIRKRVSLMYLPVYTRQLKSILVLRL